MDRHIHERIKMEQNEFIRLVSKQAGFSISDTKIFFDALGKAVEECVKEHEPFIVQNFGTLDFSEWKERVVKNTPDKPNLFGEEKVFPPTEKMYFRFSQNLKKIFKQSKK
jgi:nucleoid DNA-binding protein